MRYQKLDTLRWIATIWMIFFHTNYIFENVFDVMIFHFSDTFWLVLWRSVAILFILISGISFFLSAHNRSALQTVQKGMKRFLILGTVASLISAVTYLFFYEQRISFGIIHFFAFSTILGLFFMRFGSWNFLIGVVIIVGASYFWNSSLQTSIFIPFGVYPSDYYSADYYPILPWFWYYLIGFWWAHYLREHSIFDRIFWWNFFGDWVFSWTGKHALFLYIIHVPIIYILLRIVYWS